MITLADDDEDILESTQLLLELSGLPSDATTDPHSVLDLIRSNHPVLHLQDMNMPGLDVRDLIASIRRDSELKDTPIVLFTASNPEGPQWRATGADGCLRKPFDMGTLERLIETARTGGRDALIAPV